VTAFSIAVNRKGAERKTDFIDCVAWRQTAEFICKYFGKGSSICIVGSLQKREWTDKNGQKRYATEVIAEEASFVDSKNDSASSDQPAFAPANEQFENVTDDDNLPF
jgi:single-strand DNA-binding protein